MTKFIPLLFPLLSVPLSAYETSGIVKRDLGLKPEQLVREYVERDGKGEFLQTNTWWNTAVTCPECMGGPDTFTVVKGHGIKRLSDLQYEVSYSVIGTCSGDTFRELQTSRKQIYTVVKTAWGFKLSQYAFQMIKSDVALKKYATKLSNRSLERLRKLSGTN